jgi:hypothetical protein
MRAEQPPRTLPRRYTMTDFMPSYPSKGNPDLPYPTEKRPGTLAQNRISDFLADKYGYDETGNINPIEDPFFADVFTLMREASEATAAVEVILIGGAEKMPVDYIVKGTMEKLSALNS